MSDDPLEKAFEVLAIRIRAEMRYALDKLERATSIDSKVEANEALNSAVWNWEAFDTIWQLARGDSEPNPLHEPDQPKSRHLRCVKFT